MYLHSLSKKDGEKLDQLYSKLEGNKKFCAGYPTNFTFDYSELYRFLNLPINNFGDPFENDRRMCTHTIEREVIDFFAGLFDAKSGYVGYVTHGGTEGNQYGLHIARERLQNPIAYYSSDSHYSIPKLLDLLCIEKKEIPALSSGEMDYASLETTLIQNKSRPALIVMNYGTVITNAIDDISKVKKALLAADIRQFHIHADAALHGMVLPFIKNCKKPYRFSDGIDTLAISGHKLIGSPMPCGIALTKTYNRAKHIEYMGHTDITLAGSRNGITPLFLWYAIKRYGNDGLISLVNSCINRAEYIENKLKENGIPAWRNEYALTVVIPRPKASVTDKWLIPIDKGRSHLTALPKLTQEMLEEIIRDLKC